MAIPALALIIFLETGAMIAFLPGDSLLFVAGLYAAKGDLNIVVLNVLLSRDGHRWATPPRTRSARSVGPKIFSRPRSRFFKPEHMQAAHAFYEKHGGKAIIIARFVPLVRTFVPVVAGSRAWATGALRLFNIAGGIAWVVSMTLGGYFLGSSVPGPRQAHREGHHRDRPALGHADGDRVLQGPRPLSGLTGRFARAASTPALSNPALTRKHQRV